MLPAIDTMLGRLAAWQLRLAHCLALLSCKHS